MALLADSLILYTQEWNRETENKFPLTGLYNTMTSAKKVRIAAPLHQSWPLPVDSITCYIPLFQKKQGLVGTYVSSDAIGERIGELTN